MKANAKQIKDFDTVKTFREIKEKISLEISDMSFEELKEYLKQRKLRSENK